MFKIQQSWREESEGDEPAHLLLQNGFLVYIYEYRLNTASKIKHLNVEKQNFKKNLGKTIWNSYCLLRVGKEWWLCGKDSARV